MKLLPVLALVALILSACQSPAEPGYVVEYKWLSYMRCEVVFHGLNSGRDYPRLTAQGKLCNDLYVGMPVNIAAGGKSVTGTVYKAVAP